MTQQRLSRGLGCGDLELFEELQLLESGTAQNALRNL
jgi:hypothetical protein